MREIEVAYETYEIPMPLGGVLEPASEPYPFLNAPTVLIDGDTGEVIELDKLRI